ncbi:LamG domain-containing protein [Aestuariibaculum sp. M13]|uniref:LamG domain-containing protein n=1 Tax=Aestuariibaculum sp. M13 TaxID=2967132 RepID=UPI00215A0C8C|nr:LamG domain-containing protein [Aestuariibaculum sp. M13]MCR8667877.1 LamG domain-containing protein [Aestuariibaculum sp. M13]
MKRVSHYVMNLSLVLMLISCSGVSRNNGKIVWVMSDLLQSKEGVLVNGNPKLIESPYGKAVEFDGVDDALFLEEMPIKNLKEFTVEMIIRFDKGGFEEQRYFHTGTVSKDRSLMEMRSGEDTWYLDGMFESKEKWVVLMSPEYSHPLGEWYHIAFTVKDGQQATYVNGKKELEGNVEYKPIIEGQTSIGVRQNKLSWFKGAIYSVTITDKYLNSKDFTGIK